MVINLRGTSGSGKSTVVTRVMKLYNPDGITYCHEEGRRKPIAQILIPLRNDIRPLYVPGHYETPCGGCDTIKTPDKVYDLVKGAVQSGWDVLYEGIIIQDDVKRCAELSKEASLRVISLTTPIEECLAGIQTRRDARGDTRPLNPANTISRADRVRRSIHRLSDLGVITYELNREEAYQKCAELLGWWK